MVLHSAVCAFIIHGIENMLRTMGKQRHSTIGLYVDIVSFIGQNLAEGEKILQHRFSASEGNPLPWILVNPFQKFFSGKDFQCIASPECIGGIAVRAPEITSSETNEYGHQASAFSFAVNAVEQFHYRKLIFHIQPRFLPFLLPTPLRSTECGRRSTLPYFLR